MDINNKTILITGASGSLGRQLIDSLLKYSCNLILTGSQNNISFDIKDNESRIIYIQSDLSTRYGIDEFIKKIESKNIDMAIFSAGLQYFGRFSKQSSDLVEKMMNVNLLSPILITKALIPKMLEKNQGYLVTIGSMLGLIPCPFYASYASSKSGLWAFAQSIHREYYHKGIRVTHVSPRAMDTQMNDSVAREFALKTKTPMDSVDYVVNKIINSIISEKNHVKIGLPEKLFAAVNGLFPKVIDKGVSSHHGIAEKVFEE